MPKTAHGNLMDLMARRWDESVGFSVRLRKDGILPYCSHASYKRLFHGVDDIVHPELGTVKELSRLTKLVDRKRRGVLLPLVYTTVGSTIAYPKFVAESVFSLGRLMTMWKGVPVGKVLLG